MISRPAFRFRRYLPEKYSGLLIILLLSPLLCFSQVQYGVKGGVNFSVPAPAMNLEKFGMRPVGLYSATGYQGGLFLRVKIPLPGVFVAGELMYDNLNMGVDNVSSVNDRMYKISLHRIDLPVHLGIGFLRLFKVYVGPSFSYLVGSNIDCTQVNTYSAHSGVSVAADLGLSVTFHKFMADFRYQWGAAGQQLEIRDVNYFANQTYFTVNAKPSNLALSLAYRF